LIMSHLFENLYYKYIHNFMNVKILPTKYKMVERIT